MVSAVERLTGLVDAPDRFDIAYANLLATQVEATNERFASRRGLIRLLNHRAKEADIDAVRAPSDLVPLLFAHTAYKSYPENWLAEQRWDRMGKWLETVSTYHIEDVDLSNIGNIDVWISRLEAAGRFVSCSSGTTGKSAMLVASAADMEWIGRETVTAVSWGSGMAPKRDRKMFGLAPVAAAPRNNTVKQALIDAFCDPSFSPFVYPVPPITIGQITGMVALRKRMADGIAKPAEIAEYEATSKVRQQEVDEAVGVAAKALVDARKDMLFLTSMWATFYKVAEAVRAMGYDAKDFHRENTMYVAGGLKGAVLPENFRDYIFETFNLSPDHMYQMYGMQELHSSMPRCGAGRYHVPPWLMLLLLDEGGDRLIPVTSGEMEGRAAFFDLSIDGRWGGVISGDKIVVDYGKCACGHQGPSIRDNIARYADLPGGDKITCSGTIDAYVRGVS